MQHDDVSRGLLALEKKFWNAIGDKDAATAVALNDDPCLVVGAQGVGEVGKTSLAGDPYGRH